jgi:hypothetical protein
MPRKPSLARRRKVGRALYRQYCAGATWTEFARWYGRFGLTQAAAWELMLTGMRAGECCSIDRSA